MEINPYIEKAKKGDQVAFTYLLDYYWNEVYGFMLKRTENETDAEDIAIETFSKALITSKTELPVPVPKLKVSTFSIFLFSNNRFKATTWAFAKSTT